MDHCTLQLFLHQIWQKFLFPQRWLNVESFPTKEFIFMKTHSVWKMRHFNTFTAKYQFSARLHIITPKKIFFLQNQNFSNHQFTVCSKIVVLFQKFREIKVLLKNFCYTNLIWRNIFHAAVNFLCEIFFVWYTLYFFDIMRKVVIEEKLP